MSARTLLSKVQTATAFRASTPAVRFSVPYQAPRSIVRPTLSLVPHTKPWPRLYSTGDSDMEPDNQRVTREETTEGPNEWKLRAPYRVHEPDEKFPKRYDASCHCGQVQYQISREVPLDSKLCHCTTCQTQHAAPFQWAAIFHKTDINFTKGHHGLEWYDPSSKSADHHLPCKVRCSFCHSPIMDEGRNMILVFPSLIKMETEKDRANFKPRCHMFYGQRVVDIPDGLPKWSGINDESELIQDSPPDRVRDEERKRVAETEQHVKKGVQQAEG